MPEKAIEATPEPFATAANLLLVLHEARFAGGIAASGQRAGFGGNLFTRDSCRMMLDTVDHMPSMSRELLSILPQMQGREENWKTNEFPNAMPHQVFRQNVAGRSLPDEQVASAEYWTDKWDVPLQYNPLDGKWFAIYNSSDAAPLYLLSLAAHCRTQPQQWVLRDTFIHRPTGETRTVGEAGRRCVDFILASLNRSEARGLGLYAVPNTNPKQTSPSGVMRDGFDAYYYPDSKTGRPVDYSYLAYIDNQALAYEALTVAAKELYPDDPKARMWLDRAETLRRCTLDTFWMDDVGLFAAAVDAETQQVKLESTAAVEVLNGPFLKGLAEEVDIVRSLVSWLYSDGVMTPIGPRMLHQKFNRYEGDYYAYQGTGAVWPHVNGIIAKGLRRWGLYSSSYDLGVARFV